MDALTPRLFLQTNLRCLVLAVLITSDVPTAKARCIMPSVYDRCSNDMPFSGSPSNKS
jgi:hypothetical protein